MNSIVLKQINVKSIELDMLLAKLIILLSIVWLIANIYLINTLRILFGLLILIFCIIWVKIRKTSSLSFHTNSTNNARFENRSYILLFTILFTLSILSLYFRPLLYERPLIYFIIIFSMAGIISAEIISLQRNMTLVILFQIFLVGILNAWSQLIVFPSLLGVDPWYHQNLTFQIVKNSSIPLGFAYSKLPLFHLCIAMTSLITGLDYKYATMFSVSLSQLVCNMLFIFLLAKFILNNTRVGLYSSLLLVLSNYHIRMSFWSIPNSFASIFILIILYSLLKIRTNHKVLGVFFSIIFMISLILTHTVTAMCMSMILFITWVSFYLYNIIRFNENKSPYSFSYVILFSVFMFAWWTYASGTLTTLANLIKFGFSTDIFINSPKGLIQQSIANIPFFEKTFNLIGTLLYFTVSFVGYFYMMSNHYGNKYSFCALTAGLTPLMLGFFSSVTSHSIILERWLFFSQILLSIPLSISILLCCNSLKYNYLKKVLLVVVTIILSFFLIMNPSANLDYNKLSSHSSTREALTTSELTAIKKTSDFWDGPIKTDNYYAHAMSYTYDTYMFDNELFYNSTSSLKDHLILIRTDLIGKPFNIFSSIYLPDRDYISELIFNLEIEGYSKIYSSGSVYGYLSR